MKNTLLKYVPDRFEIESMVNPVRIFELNENKIRGDFIVYLCEREVRSKDNFALQFAIQKSNETNLPLKIIHLRQNYEYLAKENFINKQIEQAKATFKKANLNFEIINKSFKNYFKKVKPAILIVDFNPILNKKRFNDLPFKIYEIDGHNIIPARFISDKKEYSAATLRRKIYHNIYPFLTEFENISNEKVEADFVLQDFIKHKLPHYSKLKNNPTKNIQSGLSKYLNLGFISSQRVALEIIKSNASKDNKEAFLEELITRKELADNFCLYSKNYKSFSDIPNWAKFSLNNHIHDLRPHFYSKEDFEHAKTHDALWNATQTQLIKEGSIHGYLRMYWAKKIPEWSLFPKDALKIAIYLNDKYSFDSPSPNGYVGILWSIGALHDRAFADYPITGKIRKMTYNSLKRKFDIKKYINKYAH